MGYLLNQLQLLISLHRNNTVWAASTSPQFLGLWREFVLLTLRRFYLLSGAATLLFTPKVCYNIQDTRSCLSASWLLGSPPQTAIHCSGQSFTIGPILGAKVCHLYWLCHLYFTTAQYQSQMSFFVVELPPQG